jgi:hypothetical protein
LALVPLVDIMEQNWLIQNGIGVLRMLRADDGDEKK